jgi:nucleotide-binding universal stress UspA family protein
MGLPKETAMGTIVCGVDRSPGARAAVLTAVHLGRQFGVQVVAIHVVPSIQRELDVYLGERATRTAGELVASVLTSEGEGVFVGELMNEDAPHITVLGSVGDAAERLTWAAREHDASLIIFGARTQGKLPAFLRSRLAAELLEKVPVPVVVVPPGVAEIAHRWTPATKDGRDEHRATVRS